VSLGARGTEAVVGQGDAPARPDRRRALEEISVRLWAIGHALGDPAATAGELCEDAEELRAAAGRIQRLAASCPGTP
jgi:hypothetical protein